MREADPVRRLLIEAAREFNRGHYFEAHEVLEDGLDNVPEEQWELFLGLIQIAVGYHKTTQGLRSGAAGMLERGLAKVRPFPADAAGLGLGELCERVQSDLEALRSGDFEINPARPPRILLSRDPDRRS